MRGLALALTTLLLLAPMGLAQDGEDHSGSESESSSPSASPSPSPSPDGTSEEDVAAACRDPETPEEREQCMQAKRAYCAEHPDDSRCRTLGNQTAKPPQDEPKDGCRDEESASAERRCEMAVQQIKDEPGRAWVDFQVDAANATLLSYKVDGLIVLDAIHLGLDGGNLSIERQGSLITVLDGEAELRLHDEPNGLIRFKGETGNITFDFPGGASIEHADHGARVAYDGGRIGHLLAENATWLDNDTVRLDGFFRYHVPPAEPKGLDEAHDLEVEERKQEAIEHRNVGAEVNIKARPGQASSIAAADDDSVEILAYDDVDVQVELPDQAAPDSPLRVVVSSELGEGRTIVLNVDEGLLASTDPKDLVLRYFDVHDQDDGSTLETEVIFAQASSLADVLEPSDDGGQPEFWVVEDANGVQVLVSVPHWSTHAITVASIATVLKAPNVTVGIVAGAAASLVLGALLVWPRRRDDEL